MKHTALWSALAVVVAAVAFGGSALAQPAPEFKLGFKTLADLIPYAVGHPLENEHYAANGDSLQQTSTGLMVWRKADNWTAFTNGSTTWINGPSGIQTRSNSERFPWEGDARATPTPVPPRLPPGARLVPTVPPDTVARLATPTPSSQPAPGDQCFIPTDAVSFTDFSRRTDGAWWGQGTVRNPCGRAMHVEIGVTAHAGTDGRAVMDAPTLFVDNIAAGESRSINVRVPTGQSISSFRWRVASGGLGTDGYGVMDVGASSSLDLDQWLTGTVAALMGNDGGGWLAKVAAENGVKVRRGSMDIGILGIYDPSIRTVTLDTRLDAYSSWVRAAILAHELQHAADHAAGQLPRTRSECYRNEEAAFRRQAQVWGELWQYNLPAEPTSVHSMLNDIALTVNRDPVGFAMTLEERYYDQCFEYPG